MVGAVTTAEAPVKDLDIALFGATGFVGRLVAEYLSRHAPGVRIALAGRSRDRLEGLRRAIGRQDLEVVVADVDEPATLASLARRTRVLMTTVGPFARWGEPVAQACVAGGAHYLDLTGEPAYVGRLVERYHEAAQDRGVALVPCCGFDSIPPDLGAYFTVLQLPEGVPLEVTGTLSGDARFSGGTLASALGVIGEARAPERRRIDAVAGDGRRVRGAGVRPHYDRGAGLWIVPLPTIDPAIVRRSARLLPRYGPDFTYRHQLGADLATLARLGAVAGVASTGLGRRLLSRLLPPGEGPSAEVRARSWFRMRFVGRGGGVRVVTEVRGGDPGYDETAKMMSEAALCLALGEARPAGGVLTPAAAFGDALLARLAAAGLAFRVIERGPD